MSPNEAALQILVEEQRKEIKRLRLCVEAMVALGNEPQGAPARQQAYTAEELRGLRGMQQGITAPIKPYRPELMGTLIYDPKWRAK